MRSIVLALCWKEFRELTWSVIAVTGIALSLPLYALVRAPETSYLWVIGLLLIYSVVGGIFFGMRAAAGERANRAAALLAAMPIRPAGLGAIKLFATIVAVLLPIACLTILGLAVKPLAEAVLGKQESIWIFSAICALSVIHVAVVTAVFGLGQPTEVLAAGWGILVLSAWGALSILEVLVSEYASVPWFRFVVGLGPPLHALSQIEKNDWQRLLMVPAVVVVCLSITFVVRYACAITPLIERGRDRHSRWMPPAWSPLTSLAWKQLCESAPLVLLVLLIALILGFCWGTVTATDEYRRNLKQPFYDGPVRIWLAQASMVFVFFSCVGGFVLALLLGVSTFAPDLEPRVNTFWRSRPISPTQWFWSKYTVAFLSLLLAVGLPSLLVVVAAVVFADAEPWLIFSDVAGWITIGWFGIFSAAVVSTCIVRRPLYAGIFAVALVAGALALAQWLDAGWFGNEPLRHPLLIACLWIAASIAATLIAWQAAVRDLVAFE